ncbi:MAG TPA: gamma-glutamyltransferase [Candidatus Baltobacteraceae bacterium]|nr:gamma-glutamyltransferase [Candidatus Baltobacteraceae bacterium]
MPELPDIALYIRALEERILGEPISRVRIGNPFVVRTAAPPIGSLEGRNVREIRRIGKRIAIGVDGDLWLVIHLMIAGRLHWKDSGAKLGGRNSLAALDFVDGSLVLTEAGTKRRASVSVVSGEDALHLLDPEGIDVFDCDLQTFRAALSAENHTLKRALTDPHILSGIGNAYSDEILHAAKLSPVLQTHKLTNEQWVRLFDATRATLAMWIERLQTEAQDRFPEKVTAFRVDMAVHGKYGKACPVCGEKIRRIRYADNETNYCPRCQTGGKILADRALSRLGITVTLAAIVAATCTLGHAAPASRPPADSAVRGDRAEGWLQQSRSPVLARNGMVVTSQPLAAQAGLRILMEGGNAVDAAVATAATLNVVEPMMVGMGADVFAIVYIAKDHSYYALNASGMAPSGATIARLRALGYKYDPANWGPSSGMPPGGILDVTVPGSVWGWDALLRRFGTMKFDRVLAPAIDYAQNGYPVSERIAGEWVLPPALPLRKCCTRLDPDSVRTWYVNGKPPKTGDIYRNPALAHSFRLLQKYGRDVFYRGEIARAIVAKSRALGGTMTMSDLANYRGEWEQPVDTVYHGYHLLELPPPSQDFAANEALNILQACVPKVVPVQSLASLGPANPEYWHLLVEAKKLAYRDLYRYNADPDKVHVPLERLLSTNYAASLCSQINPNQASRIAPPGPNSGAGDTIVLSTADRWGNMVSFVNSNYDEFGSGITVPGYGFILHDRGALFSLDPKSPNAIAPHKRPFNTLSAGFIAYNNRRPLMTLGLMGGDMQAQGHEQIAVDVIDLGANIQQAGDMARFRQDEISGKLYLESPLYALVGEKLRAMGHNVRSTNRAPMGGYQAIMLLRNGAYAGGSDFGKDGEAVGW